MGERKRTSTIGEAGVGIRCPSDSRGQLTLDAGCSDAGTPRRSGVLGLPVPNAGVCTNPALSHVPTAQVLNAVYDHLAR